MDFQTIGSDRKNFLLNTTFLQTQLLLFMGCLSKRLWEKDHKGIPTIRTKAETDTGLQDFHVKWIYKLKFLGNYLVHIEKYSQKVNNAFSLQENKHT